MSTVLGNEVASDQPLNAEDGAGADRRRRRLEIASLVAIVGLALALNTWALARNDLGNTYYSAAVRSMNRSWRNFFFVAFDPGGFISVDKPPVALWAQAMSVRVLGFSSWSLLLPDALAGTASVAVLWAAVRRHFGPVAAGVAGLVLALSPINVAVNRLNLPDPFMILFLLTAAWALLRFLDGPRARWLVVGGAAVGLAFNTKMLAAAIPVPALAGALLIGTRGGWLARVRSVLVFGLAALAFSAPWMLAVDLTPPSARPYVGGSTKNSVLDLALGYNGLSRVDGGGQFGGGRARTGGFGPGGGFVPGGGPAGGSVPPGPADGRSGPGAGFAGPGFAGAGVAGPGGILGDQPGALRLFGAAVGGQIAWLLPLAGLAAAVTLWRYRRDRVAAGALVLWAGWTGLHAVVFSGAAGIFHSYYTSALAPGIAALVGIGAGELLRHLHPLAATARRTRAIWSLGALTALAATVWLHVLIGGRAGTFYAWTRPIVVALAVVAAVGLLVGLASRARRGVPAALAVGLTAILVTPAAWAASEATNPTLNATLPQAGPRGGAAGSSFGSARFEADPALATFLLDHREGRRWDLVVGSAMQASSLVARHDLSVMALGGFLGADPAATVDSIARLVDEGQARFFLVGGGPDRFGPPGAFVLPAPGSSTRMPLPDGGFAPGQGGGSPPGRGGPGGRRGVGGPRGFFGAGRGTSAAILSAVEQACEPARDTTSGVPPQYQQVLFDCAGHGDQLRAARAISG